MSNIEKQKGKPLNDDQKFYLEWGKESIKNNIKLLNDMLSKMIVLNASFAGGAVVQKVIIDSTPKTILIVIFLIALVISFIGYMPFENAIDISAPNEIKVHKKKALKHKRIYLWLAASIMCIGFSISIILIAFDN